MMMMMLLLLMLFERKKEKMVEDFGSQLQKRHLGKLQA
jgi:hypothetical protein